MFGQTTGFSLNQPAATQGFGFGVGTPGQSANVIGGAAPGYGYGQNQMQQQVPNTYASNGPSYGFCDFIVMQTCPVQQPAQVPAYGQPPTQFGQPVQTGFGAPQAGFGQPATGFNNGFQRPGTPGGWGQNSLVGQPQYGQVPPVGGIVSEQQYQAVNKTLELSQMLRTAAMAPQALNQTLTQQQLFQRQPVSQASVFSPPKSQQQEQQSQNAANQLYESLKQTLTKTGAAEPAVHQMSRDFSAVPVPQNHGLDVRFSGCMQNDLVPGLKNTQKQQQQPLDTSSLRLDGARAEVPTMLGNNPGGNPRVPKVADGYYSVPDVKQLQQLSDDQLAHVSGFSLIRQQAGQIVGQISFLSPVNLLDVDVTKYVQIEHKTLNVDLIDNIGLQLNGPAIVKLFHVRPDDHTTVKETYIRQIADATARMGGALLSYDWDAGVWVFQVQGFH